ncbi:hypothetical protein AAW12_05870 [Sphingobacterium sp. Ag1]|uniref:hypothetical protein n=1 Tax=Sphingobacterium sp. Ag1 TaxID=1643451 RepID=UPI0006281062|nr:hypothetical protein [Sphingobacterium sp. Ag1]KKO92274.1 hypothetical protein AAW12_05870 [Sphingobacterium sp. Ag1]
MKNTQKKLKAKHFRYLSQEYIDDPMKYLEDFFVNGTRIDYWLRDVNLLINIATNHQMASPTCINNYYIKELIQQVEIAYIIFKKCNIQIIENPLFFFSKKADYWKYTIDGIYTNNGIESSTDSIARFFSYKTLRQWYEVLDDLWIKTGNADDEFMSNQADEILAILELIQRLAVSLDKIRESGTLPGTKDSKENLKVKSKNQRIEQIGDSKDSDITITEHKKNPDFYPKKQVKIPLWLAPQAFSMEAIQSFFIHNCLDGWREYIKYWHRAAITENCSWSAGSNYSSSTLLFTYSCIYSLLEMFRNEADLRKITCTVQDPKQQIILRYPHSILIKHKEEKYTLNYTSTEQLEDSFLSIANLINQHAEIEWNEILYDWLEYGLSKEAYSNAEFSNQTLCIHDRLINIIELAYLLAYKDEIEILDTAFQH